MPSDHQLKYGHHHRQLRKAWATAVLRGNVACARCGKPILATHFWDLGHVDGSLEHSGPEHRRCNRSTAGNGAANTQRPAVRVTSRDW